MNKLDPNNDVHKRKMFDKINEIVDWIEKHDGVITDDKGRKYKWVAMDYAIPKDMQGRIVGELNQHT